MADLLVLLSLSRRCGRWPTKNSRPRSPQPACSL